MTIDLGPAMHAGLVAGLGFALLGILLALAIGAAVLIFGGRRGR